MREEKDWWEQEKLYRLSDLSRRGVIPLPVKRRTLQEYVKVGAVARNCGERLRLEAIRVGGVYYSSVERVLLFVKLLQDS